MRNFSFLILIVSVSVFLFGCNPSTPVITDEASYVKSIEEWQVQRLERLKSKNGWLSLSGLFWLEEGENSYGSDPENDIVFPEKADAFCGKLVLDSGSVTLRVAEGVDISV